MTSKSQLDSFACHKLFFTQQGDHAVGDCPFCGREGKFTVAVETGLWDCKVCKTGSSKGGGNIYTFLRELWNVSEKTTRSESYSQLVKNRKLIGADTLILWGICVSALSKRWLIPGWNIEGKLCQLYRYVKDTKSGKMCLKPTTGLPQSLHGVNLFDPKKPRVYVCEGPWDAMALWEVLRRTKILEGEYKVTGSEDASLLATANVIAAPGSGSFREEWGRICAGKEVVLMYDSDHERTENGRVISPAGYSGMKRVVEILSRAEEPPKSIQYLNWGPNGFDPTLPSGTDVRDILSGKEADSIEKRILNLEKLMKKVQPIPSEWIKGRTREAAKTGAIEIELKTCTEWKVLTTAWRKSLKWTEGLDRALSVMLASVISTTAVGDQLWIKIIGPAACGKSTLCEALAVAKKYVLSKSTIRGFHSGFQTDRAGEQDNSLIALVKDKTLVTKDGDTLLQSPNLGQILSEARDVYDRTSRTHYRNAMSKDYEGVSMTWLLCGTSSLRSIDSSELGERFLDCVIIEDIEDELEDMIALRKARQAARELTTVVDGNPNNRDGPEMVLSKQLTGGYVEYLRKNSEELLRRVETPEEALIYCARLGKFVAITRARPSEKQKEKAEREMSFRLVSQIVRLAICLAAVLNRKTLDDEVIRRVKRVAMDTARGRTLELLKWIVKAGKEGATLRALSLWTGHDEVEERKLLKFLRGIKAVELHRPESKNGIRGQAQWRLSASTRGLWEEVSPDS